MRTHVRSSLYILNKALIITADDIFCNNFLHFVYNNNKIKRNFVKNQNTSLVIVLAFYFELICNKNGLSIIEMKQYIETTANLNRYCAAMSQ